MLTKNDYLKERKKLNDKLDDATIKRNYVKIAKLKTEMAELDKRFQFVAENEKITLHELLKDLPDDIRSEFDVLTAMLLACVNLADDVVTDINSMLVRHSPDDFEPRLVTTNMVKDIKDLTNKFIKISDHNCNLATANNYGELTDLIKPVVRRKTEEHLAWTLDNNHVKYAKN